MASLVLTVVGDDRAGIVHAIAETVAEHGGNWERSEFAELAGEFAGIVLVSVADDHAAGLSEALRELDGLLSVTVRPGAENTHPAGVAMAFTVLGNDRPGIVRDITNALTETGVTIDQFSSRTTEAPMSGGMLFEATVVARAPGGIELSEAATALERLAGEIQVDVTVTG